VGALPAFGQRVLRFEIPSPTEIRGSARRELVAGGEQQFRPEALHEGPPRLVAMQRRPQRADALGGDDRDQARLSGEGEGAFIATRIRLTDRGKRVILVADKQEVASHARRLRGHLRNPLQHRALEVQLQQHAQRARPVRGSSPQGSSGPARVPFRGAPLLAAAAWGRPA
jgi:hypothetical protein